MLHRIEDKKLKNVSIFRVLSAILFIEILIYFLKVLEIFESATKFYMY